MGSFLSGLSDDFDFYDLTDEEFQEHILSFIMANDIIKEEIEELSLPKTSRKRRKSCAVFADTTWGKMLSDPATADPYSFWGKKFPRRFRVPFGFFKDVLVPMCEAGNVFELKQKSPLIPIEIRIMVALRILGRDEVADTVSELSDIGESTCLSIFDMFVKNFSKVYYESYVRFPEGYIQIE